MKEIVFLFALGRALIAACPDSCWFQPCQQICLQKSCGMIIDACFRIDNCPKQCWGVFGDLVCDESCDVKECLWDGFDCLGQCSEGCDMKKDFNNGKCDQPCFNEACGWDGNDCKSRSLTGCDCGSVTRDTPVEYFIGKTREINNLSSFFQSQICCKFVSVILEDDSDFSSSSAFQLNLKNLEVLTISSKSKKIVKIDPVVQLSVFGTNLIWKNIEFRFNDSLSLGNSHFQVFDDGKIQFKDCEFKGILGNFIQVFQGVVEMSQVGFSGEVISRLFRFEECLEDCQFSMQNGKISQLISKNSEFLLSENTRVHLQQVLIEKCEFGGIFFDLSRHSFEMNSLIAQNSTIKSLVSGIYLEKFLVSDFKVQDCILQDLLFSIKYSTNLQVSSVLFSNLSCTEPIFYLSGSEGSFFDTSVFYSTCQSFLVESSTSVVFSNLTINASRSTSASLNSTNSLITLKNSSFLSLSGTAFFLSSSKFLITSTSFVNCASRRGGAAMIMSSCGQITESLFSNNKALSKGGALYINSENCVSITKSRFSENVSRNGGAVFSTQNLTESENIYSNNQALQGDDRASSISTIYPEKSFESARPGKEVSGTIKFTMADIYNQTVLLESVSWLALSISSPNNLTSISGTQFNKSHDGVFLFSGLTFYGSPGSTLTLQVDLFCEDPYCRRKTDVVVQVPLSQCLSGEVLSDKLNSCVQCEQGFYSINNNEKSCRTCPDNAECYSNRIIPKAGYWHSNENSSKIFKCINQNSCLEGNKCEKGYSGNLCAVCETGYISSTSNTCKTCPSRTSNVVLIIFLVILFGLIITYVIYRTYEDAYEPKLYHSVLIKILMNYFQLMMLTSDIKVHWPEPFYDMINVQEQIGSNTGKLLSLDCLIQETTSLDPYFVNQLLSFLAPLVLGGLITVVWAVIALFIEMKTRVVKPFITSLVVVFFILHPGISSSALSIVSCYELEPGEYWNTNSFDIQCYTQDYAKQYYALFVLDIVFWTIGMPVVAYVMLWKNKNELEDPSTKAKYGFLYHGYQPERFYWEFIIMLRKLLIISVAILMRYSTVSLQLIFVLIVLLAALALNQYYKPFELQELNRTENYSIVLSIVCLTSALMIESGASKGLHIFLFIVLVLSNFFFFCYFAKRVYQAVGHYLWSNCPHIARNICPNAQRPKIKIREILQKEERRNRNKKVDFEPQSGFVDHNKEVVIQLLNMRHFADFYNEVLAARFSGDNIRDVEDREIMESENNQAALDNAMTINESRPFFRRIFTRKRKNLTVQQKILSIRRQSLVDNSKRRVSSDGGNVEAEE